MKNSPKQIHFCLFLANFGLLREENAFGPLRPPPHLQGLWYYQICRSQKDNQLWQSSGEVQNLAENIPIWWGLDGVQFTHPLAEITQRTRWGPGKFQVTLKPFRESRTNHYKSSLPTLGSFMYPQGVQNGLFGLKQTLTGRKALYSEKSTLHGYATAWTEAYSVAKMVSCHNPVYSDESSSMKRLSTKLSISVAITTWEKVMSEMPKKKVNCTIERDNLGLWN